MFAPPPGLSQLATSFFASESQGIPRAPLIDFLVSSFNCIFFAAASPNGAPRALRLILGFLAAQKGRSLFSYMSCFHHVKDLSRLSRGADSAGSPPVCPIMQDRVEIADGPVRHCFRVTCGHPL